jgi:hypothetical protein
MPFGGYSDFDACVADQIKKGKDKDSATKICGAMQAQAEGGAVRGGTAGGNFASSDVNRDGDLFIKYKLIDDTMGKSGFQLTNLDTRLKQVIGKPWLRKAEDPTQTRMHDGHLWSMIPNAGLQEHVTEAWRNADGVVVDFTSEQDRMTPLKGGNSEPNTNTSSKYVNIKVIHPVKRQQYIDHPATIPKFVSIGVWDNDFGTRGNTISDYEVVHVQAVDNPAWKDAQAVGTCMGTEHTCNNALKGAGLTSLVESSGNNFNNMSANQSTVGSTDSTTVTTTGTGNAQPPVVNNNAASQPVLRLKTAGQQQGALSTAMQAPAIQQPNAEQQQQGGIENDPEIVKIKMQLDELTKKEAENARRNIIKELIPKDLFIIKGKLNEDAFNKEVEKVLQKNWTDDTVRDVYQARLQILKMSQQQYGGYNTPQGAGGNSLYGGSIAETENPELKGGSGNNQAALAFKSLTRMMGVNIK